MDHSRELLFQNLIWMLRPGAQLDLTRESQNPEPRTQEPVQHAVGSLSGGGAPDGWMFLNSFLPEGRFSWIVFLALGTPVRMHFNRLNEASAFHVVEFVKCDCMPLFRDGQS